MKQIIEDLINLIDNEKYNVNRDEYLKVSLEGEEYHFEGLFDVNYNELFDSSISHNEKEFSNEDLRLIEAKVNSHYNG